MDLPEHRCCTKIEETTNQTKSQQMNPVLVFDESRQPEYATQPRQSREPTTQAIHGVKGKN